MFFIALLVEISSDGGFSPPNPSVFSGIRLFILIYQKLQFYVELAEFFCTFADYETAYIILLLSDKHPKYLDIVVINNEQAPFLQVSMAVR